jgi:hypothetical protein
MKLSIIIPAHTHVTQGLADAATRTASLTDVRGRTLPVARETVLAGNGQGRLPALWEHAFLPCQYFLEFVLITP